MANYIPMHSGQAKQAVIRLSNSNEAWFLKNVCACYKYEAYACLWQKGLESLLCCSYS